MPFPKITQTSQLRVNGREPRALVTPKRPFLTNESVMEEATSSNPSAESVAAERRRNPQ